MVKESAPGYYFATGQRDYVQVDFSDDGHLYDLLMIVASLHKQPMTGYVFEQLAPILIREAVAIAEAQGWDYSQTYEMNREMAQFMVQAAPTLAKKSPKSLRRWLLKQEVDLPEVETPQKVNGWEFRNTTASTVDLDLDIFSESMIEDLAGRFELGTKSRDEALPSWDDVGRLLAIIQHREIPIAASSCIHGLELGCSECGTGHFANPTPPVSVRWMRMVYRIDGILNKVVVVEPEHEKDHRKEGWTIETDYIHERDCPCDNHGGIAARAAELMGQTVRFEDTDWKVCGVTNNSRGAVLMFLSDDGGPRKSGEPIIPPYRLQSHGGIFTPGLPVVCRETWSTMATGALLHFLKDCEWMAEEKGPHISFQTYRLGTDFILANQDSMTRNPCSRCMNKIWPPSVEFAGYRIVKGKKSYGPHLQPEGRKTTLCKKQVRTQWEVVEDVRPACEDCLHKFYSNGKV